MTIGNLTDGKKYNLYVSILLSKCQNLPAPMNVANHCTAVVRKPLAVKGVYNN